MWSPRFLTDDTPLKEGRLPVAVPGGEKEVNAQRTQRIKQIILVVALLAIFRTISVFYWESPDRSIDLGDAGAAKVARSTVSDAPESPLEASSTSSEVNKPFPTLEGVRVQDADLSAPKGGQKPMGGPVLGASSKSSSKSAPAKEQFSPRLGFEEALAKIINMLPSELETRGLLRPIDLTAESRLREYGMLARKYKKYYEAWEVLHVATDAEGGTYVRDDVIQYLRHRATLATSTEDHNELVQNIHAYEEFRHLLVQLNELLFPYTAPYFSDHMTLRSHLKKGGRGIVLTAGNDQVAYLLTQIPILRQLGCNLPIEVMYAGDNDLNRDSRQDLEDLDGVVTRDIMAMVKPVGWDVASWAAKPFAILLSSFREAIFIDADSFFFVNPEVMFDDPGYVKTGALFFRDRLIMPESKKSWLQSILPQPVSKNVKHSRLWKGESGHQQESGVMVVDKYRHFLAMLFVTRMNGPDRDGNREERRIGVYDMVYGDKETFWLGWELVGDTDYVFHDGDAGIIGLLEAPPKRRHTRAPIEGEEGELPGEGDDPATEEDIDPYAGMDEDSHKHTLEWDPNSSSGNDTDNEGLPKHKICSPQLLHLDYDGKPMWFNGGLVRNKFLDRREWKFGTWDTYLIEPREIREPGAWFLGEANMCCLTTDNHLKGDLSVKDRALLDSMVAQARKVGIAT